MPLPLTSSWRKKPATAIIARRPFWSSLRTETNGERETHRPSDMATSTPPRRQRLEAKDRDAGRGLGSHLGEFLRVRGLEAGRVEADVARVVLVLETCVESKFQAPSVLNRCGDLHAIDATLARLRGGAGLSPLYGANGPIIAEK